VIEIEAGQQILPAAGDVTALAGFLEGTLVRIDVTSGAGVELHILVTSRASRCVGFVALFAWNLYVESCQRIPCFGVIEILGSLPAIDVVALGTFIPISKLTFVRIRVARRANRRLAEEGLGQILHFNQFTVGRKHVRRGMALFTGEGSVLAFQFEAGEFVIELLQTRFPANQLEVFAIVVQVASDTVFSVGIAHLHFEMIAVLRRKILRDLLVAVEALKGRRACSKNMARIALAGSAERRMGFGKRAGRNLGACGSRHKQTDAKEQERKKHGPFEKSANRVRSGAVRRALAHAVLRVTAWKATANGRKLPQPRLRHFYAIRNSRN